MEKQAAIAEAAGTSLDRAVKATVYIGHPSEFEGMDKVWKRWFPENPPARTVIPYMGLGGRGSRVEVAFKLLSGKSELSIETIEAAGVPPGLGHEPQAVKAGNFLFFSTVAPFDHMGIAGGVDKASSELPVLRAATEVGDEVHARQGRQDL